MVNRFTKKLRALSEKQLVLYLFFLSLILRFTYAAFIFFTVPNDENNAYILIAKEIIKQGLLFYSTNSEYFDAAGPVLPWLNAITMYVFGKSFLGIYFITAIGSSLITVFTYKTARLFLNKKTSLLIGLWALFYPFYFYYTPSPGKDIWMAFFMIYIIYMLIKLFVKNEFSYPSFLFFILMYVVSFHLDERYIIFSPFLVLLIFYNESNFFTTLKLKKTLLFICFTILLMIPWTIRNYYKYNKIVILSTRTERYTDKIFGYEKKDEYFSDDFTSIKGLFYVSPNQIDSIISGEKTITDAGFKIPKAWAKAMKDGHRPAPLKGINAFGSRIRTMFEPFQIKGRFERTGYFYYKKSSNHNLITFLFYGTLFFFSFPGFYFLYLQNKQMFYLFFSSILIYALLHALTISYTNWRYRLPLDSIFIIVGCLGIAKLYTIIKNRF